MSVGNIEKLCADFVRTRFSSQTIGLAVRIGGKRE